MAAINGSRGTCFKSLSLLNKATKCAHSVQSPVHRCLTIYNVCKWINESIICRNHSYRIKVSQFHVKLSINISLTIHSFTKLFRWPRNQGFNSRRCKAFSFYPQLLPALGPIYPSYSMAIGGSFYLRLSSAKAKDSRSYASIPPYIFKAWCLINTGTILLLCLVEVHNNAKNG